MTESERRVLHEGAAKLGFDDRTLLERIERYHSELGLWNGKLRLVDASGQALIVRHLLDCLAAVPAIAGYLARESAAIADLGSGAGLPGILLAMALPDTGVTLVERSGRRCGFLRNCRAVLGLGNVEVLQQEFESLAADRFDLLTSRAFAPLSDDFLAHAVRTLKPGGVGVFLKGTRERIDEELGSLTGRSTTGGATTGRSRSEADSASGALPVFEVVPVEIPFLDEQRHLVIMKASR